MFENELLRRIGLLLIFVIAVIVVSSSVSDDDDEAWSFRRNSSPCLVWNDDGSCGATLDQSLDTADNIKSAIEEGTGLAEKALEQATNGNNRDFERTLVDLEDLLNRTDPTWSTRVPNFRNDPNPFTARGAPPTVSPESLEDAARLARGLRAIF